MDIDLSKYIPSITRILSNSDLNVVSAWDVRSNLEQNYSIDLNSRKKEVRKIVQLCYNKICDKEEEMMEVERYEIEGEKELKNKRKREDEDYEVDEVEGGQDNTHKCTNEVEEGNEDDMVEVEEIEEVVVASGEAIMYNVNKEEIEGDEGEDGWDNMMGS
ncbi:4672_t:CDS:2 [Diversispora eburnea]|uniref:4672_t:CDS:1 n=1 Tax=Diversispora eburnea TaxID=1213867 RepID=A0A9N8VEI3_9GLOM|nr:4672_t:CDS:2 [Diversispora eburnea]